jgi:hypothetical protein
MTIEQSYSKAPHFDETAVLCRDIYGREWSSLSELNQTATREIARTLGITTEFRDSREFKVRGSKSGRLLALLQQMGATRYISGPSAKTYLDLAAFERAGIAVTWKDYGAYPEYRQLHGPFVGDVSIIDLLMCCGPASADYIWGRDRS